MSYERSRSLWLDQRRAIVLLALCLAPLACLLLAIGQESPRPVLPAAPDLFSRVISNEKKSELLLDQYERIEKVEHRKSGGDPNPVETKILRLFPTGTGVDKIPLPADGQAPAGESYISDLEKLEKYLVWIVQDGSGQKEAYQKADRKRKERHELIEATHQAFLFAPQDQESRGGRTLLRYSMTPNPSYQPTSRNTTLFTKVRGTVWIDEQSGELAKIEGLVTEDVSLALFLAKVYRGSAFMQERYEISPGNWQPTFEQFDFDGRKYLVPFSIHERTFYSGYKRVGPPRESVEVVRDELDKLRAAARHP